jgi:uncharacterized SAM-binding protein YcdF (DUF218 family)
MTVFLTAAVAALLLPPMCFVLAALAGLALLARRRRTAGSLLVLGALAALTMASTPYVAERLLASLEGPPLVLPTTPSKGSPPGTRAAADAAVLPPAAIVVLGGGIGREAPEYGTDTVNASTLVRLRYAAWLHRRTGLPILVSGGRPFDTRLSEAETMRDALAADFRAVPRWVEGESLNTRENAVNAQALLAADSVRRIYLVTHAWHMPRARRAFEQAGLEVVPAPTGYTSITPSPVAWVPSAQALRDTHLAMREWLGRAWYRLNSALRG